MDRFKEHRVIELQNMIDERKAKWDAVKEERNRMEAEIGKLQAQILFWETTGKDKDHAYNEMVNRKNDLLTAYQAHIANNKDLASTLDGEIIMLEELKCKSVEE